MTAAEIRALDAGKLENAVEPSGLIDLQLQQFRLLREQTAQLAELNETLHSLSISLTGALAALVRM